MSDVFISYSRKDQVFVRKLHTELVNKSKDIWIDFEDIPKGLDFLQEIYDGIEKADLFCFIVSRYSLTSEVCNLELAHALALSKRILPIIHEKIEGDVYTWVKGKWSDVAWKPQAERNWTEISHLNWLFFDQENQFDAEFDALIATASQDIAHVKQHTRLLIRALEWERSHAIPAQRDESYLLFADEIQRAEDWLTAWDALPTDKRPQPAPDALHRHYVLASREADRARQHYLAQLQIQREVAEHEAQRASEVAQTQRQLADQQQRRARMVSLIAIMLIVVAGIVGMVALVQTNVANETRVLANAAQDTVATKVAELNAIVPGATQGAVWAGWSWQLPLTERVAMIQQGAPARITNHTEWTPIIETIGDIPYVLVPPGCFLMGSAEIDGQTVREECLNTPFWMTQTEITNAQYGSVGCEPSNDPTEPRNCVSWADAQAFCEAMGATLPTEIEWEYGARGVESWVYPWGNDWDETRITGQALESVGSHPEGASWVGALDMIGNVSEWTSTLADSANFPTPSSLDTLLGNDARARIIRGGTWLNFFTVDFRAAFRFTRQAQDARQDVGFRCIRALTQ